MYIRVRLGKSSGFYAIDHTSSDEEDEVQMDVRDVWDYNPEVSHSTPYIEDILYTGFLLAERGSMKDALCDGCDHGVSFSVGWKSRAYGRDRMFGNFQNVLRGRWYFFALERRKGFEYRYKGMRYVTIVASRRKRAPCEHCCPDVASSYVYVDEDGNIFFNNEVRVTLLVHEDVSVRRFAVDYNF